MSKLMDKYNKLEKAANRIAASPYSSDQDRKEAVWFSRHNELPPAQHVVWGWEGTRFSARTALRDMETAENEMFV